MHSTLINKSFCWFSFFGNRDTTRKVAMADEVEVAPWLLVYHGRRFWVCPLCMSKRFFSRFWGHLARRKRPKRRVWWPGTWCISKSRVRRPSQRKSAPPRDVGPRWQPLWHCFFSRSRHLVQRSPIEPFTMQDHGSRMSSSMNQNSFYSWIFFDPLISGYFLFLLIPCRLGNVETAAAKWDPHVILYEQSTFFSWSFFWHLIFGHLPFSFDLMPRLKRWGTCWLMGPACHPLCAIKVSFVGFFFTLWFLACLFLLIPCPLWNVE